MNESAWLIEHDAGEAWHHFRTYWCGPGDWCCNPGHAQRFPSREVAEKVMGVMKCIEGSFTVSEHQWHTPPENSHEQSADPSPPAGSGGPDPVPGRPTITLLDGPADGFDQSD